MQTATLASQLTQRVCRQRLQHLRQRWGNAHSLRRFRPAIHVHPSTTLGAGSSSHHLPLPLLRDEVQVCETVLRQLGPRSVHGRAGKPKHLICFWVSIEVFRCTRKSDFCEYLILADDAATRDIDSKWVAERKKSARKNETPKNCEPMSTV